MSVFIGYPSFMAYQMMKGKKGNNDGFPSIPGMIARYSTSGLTNEQMAANPVWVDKTGNGHDIQLKNFSWKGMSGINTYNLTPSEALRVKDRYPKWKIGIDVVKGHRYQYGEDLWEVLQGHKTQENWKPSLETASLWKRVDEEHAGTKDDPIPYAPPMEIFKDKYYTQSRVLYKCIRDSGQPLSHNLSDLVGNYVEKA